ncbi:MAG TPA: GNAT family N-acetyltransferase [Spirochaetales bacterium]|mgnify:CR=1 FL=1|nr:GNAT family N-acetyltransferase [Spirochaetales bacterium]HPS15392.1 GNAT family N-acetyltransferase [Spirochaetales bacterium]
MTRKVTIDILGAARLCADAFFHDPLDSYFFPDEATRFEKQVALYNFFIRTNLRNVIVTSDKIEGIALVERPMDHQSSLTTSSLASGFSLLTLGISTIRKMIAYQLTATQKQKALIKDPFWYVRIIAVDPRYQHSGYASRLLRPVLQEATARREPVFLETHNSANLPLYEHLGFAVIDQTVLRDSGLVHYCMVRK